GGAGGVRIDLRREKLQPFLNVTKRIGFAGFLVHFPARPKVDTRERVRACAVLQLVFRNRRLILIVKACQSANLWPPLQGAQPEAPSCRGRPSPGVPVYLEAPTIKPELHRPTDARDRR